MGQVLLMTSVSLDGFFEGPDADISWSRVDEELHRHFNDVLRPMSAYLEGRVTHELMAGFWPGVLDAPDEDPIMRDYAGIWASMPKHVFSRTRTDIPWATAVHDHVDPGLVRALAADGDVSVGGALLGESLLELGLVDELRVYVHPVAIGAGRRFLADGRRLELHLLETHRFGNDVVMLRYAVEH